MVYGCRVHFRCVILHRCGAVPPPRSKKRTASSFARAAARAFPPPLPPLLQQPRRAVCRPPRPRARRVGVLRAIAPRCALGGRHDQLRRERARWAAVPMECTLLLLKPARPHSLKRSRACSRGALASVCGPPHSAMMECPARMSSVRGKCSETTIARNTLSVTAANATAVPQTRK
jgi:hypothetical protein